MTKAKRKKTTTWNAYLPIDGALKQDEPPDADVTWLASRGIEPEALSVLRCVRLHVLPLVHQLQKKKNKILESFSFLVHDRTSGVPCSAADHTAYIHLRLVVESRTDLADLLPASWVMIKRITPTDEEIRVHEILNLQSELYLALVELHADKDNLNLLKEVRQFLHYFANMSQMRIS